MIERTEGITHELANLLDGSSRCLSLALTRLERSDTDPTGVEEARRQLSIVAGAMREMSGLVHAILAGRSAGSAWPLGIGESGSLADALHHAAAVMRPVAERRSVRIEVDTEAATESICAGPVYACVTGAIRNAVESIDRSGHGGGLILVRGLLAGGVFRIEVIDDGEGLPEGDPDRLFDAGASTKGSTGLGLSFAQDLVRSLGGSVRLEARPGRANGARLVVEGPATPLRDVQPGGGNA